MGEGFKPKTLPCGGLFIFWNMAIDQYSSTSFMLQETVLVAVVTMVWKKLLCVMVLVKYVLKAHPRCIRSLHVFVNLDMWGVPAHVKVTH